MGKFPAPFCEAKSGGTFLKIACPIPLQDSKPRVFEKLPGHSSLQVGKHAVKRIWESFELS